MCFSFSTFFSFHAIFHVFTVSFSQFSRYSVFLPYSKSYTEHFSLSTHPKVWISHFFCFSVFSPYSRYCTEQFSFSTFFCFSCHIPGQTVFVSHFSTFFSFLAIILVLQCEFIIFNIFECFRFYFTSYSVCFSFFMLSNVSRHTPVCISYFPCSWVLLTIIQVL